MSGGQLTTRGQLMQGSSTQSLSDFYRLKPIINLSFFLTTSSCEAHDCCDHLFFMSPEIHELWRSMTSTCLSTEVKRQWATLVTGMGDRFSPLLMSLMALCLAPVDRNLFRPCFQSGIRFTIRLSRWNSTLRVKLLHSAETFIV